MKRSQPSARPPRRPAFRPLSRLALMAVLLVQLLVGVRPGAAEEPRFLLEKVTVSGTSRASADAIIVAESRLVAGRAYSEVELREAVYRVRRLSFVVSADFSLRRGSERGTYELVIAVQRTSAGFFAADLETYRVDPFVAQALGYDTHGTTVTQASGTAGFRLFLGPRGVLFGAARGQELQAGYTRYGLFGGNGFAGVAVAYSGFDCCSGNEVLPLGLDPRFVAWSLGQRRRASLSLGVPLAGNQSLRAAASFLKGDTSFRDDVLDNAGELFLDEKLERQEAELAWLYDTRDDPLFASRGLLLSAGLEYSRIDTPLQVGAAQTLPPPRANGRSIAHQIAAVLEGTAYHALTARQSISLGARVARGEGHIRGSAPGLPPIGPGETQFVEGSAELRHSVSLWGFERTRRDGDLRLETSATWGGEWVDPDLGFGPVRRVTFATSLVFRNPWGIFRAGLTHLDVTRSER